MFKQLGIRDSLKRSGDLRDRMSMDTIARGMNCPVCTVQQIRMSEGRLKLRTIFYRPFGCPPEIWEYIIDSLLNLSSAPSSLKKAKKIHLYSSPGASTCPEAVPLADMGVRVGVDIASHRQGLRCLRAHCAGFRRLWHLSVRKG